MKFVGVKPPWKDFRLLQRIRAHFSNYRLPSLRSLTPATQHSLPALQLQLTLPLQTNEGEEFQVSHRNSRQEYFILSKDFKPVHVRYYGHLSLRHTVKKSKKKNNNVGISNEVTHVSLCVQLTAPETRALKDK